ncbi:hypothetical protein C7410_11665 [Paraburkholderia silvatlantica]|uniref:Uncharacterized protein n=1 Tax=Paraburkholderia silvatlantica TaxID=321895 RepID=A0A2V4TRL7_9BURK|nr:hypothetical protein C7410_11665 [Paraburkholderia silvatlantica]
MPSGRRKSIPPDSLMQLRQRLDRLPRKSPERAALITANRVYCRRLNSNVTARSSQR